jgi:two-component system, OmpR family, phosphate regulon sensor histidine kinase PhoR
MTLSNQPWRILLFSGVFVAVAFALAFWVISNERDRQFDLEQSEELLLLGRVVRATLQETWPNLAAADLHRLEPALKSEQVTLLILGPERKLRWKLGASPPGAGFDELPFAADGARNAVTGLQSWGAARSQYAIAALPIASSAEPQGVIWLAKPAWSLTADTSGLTRVLGLAAALMALVTVLLAFFMFRLRARLFRRLVRAARRLSKGDLRTEIEISGSDELALLSNALNKVRSRLLAQVETIDRQRRTLEALVNQLHEGVVVTRDDGRIALINPAAVRLLNLDVHSNGIIDLVGRPVEQCIPQHPLQRLLLDPRVPVRAADDEVPPALEQKPIAIEGPDRTTYVLADASTLALASPDNPDEDTPGRALVLTEVTELQRTIQLRTDFVANASHELRTPLSTIRAAIETLLAMDLATEAGAAQNFLNAIDRHSARLQDLVSDLLDLSRLEAPNKPFEPEAIAVHNLLEDLHARFAESLDRKELHWRAQVTPPEFGMLSANPQLLRLAIDNLVENAIKFTDPGGTIKVLIHHAREHQEVAIAVVDDGCGIPAAERDRVFERFYQVERGRSGAERGTGLGLSIVRHAVGAMKGRAELESVEGHGTRITLYLPLGTPQRVQVAG